MGWNPGYLFLNFSTLTEFVTERGFLEVTGLPYDAYQAEISTSSETMKCSIFDYPMEVYGVTGGLVKDSIITCGGRGFKNFSNFSSMFLNTHRTIHSATTARCRKVVDHTVKKYLHDIFYYVFNYIVNVVGTRN